MKKTSGNYRKSGELGGLRKKPQTRTPNYLPEKKVWGKIIENALGHIEFYPTYSTTMLATAFFNPSAVVVISTVPFVYSDPTMIMALP